VIAAGTLNLQARDSHALDAGDVQLHAVDRDAIAGFGGTAEPIEDQTRERAGTVLR
jgi:hypothetical protein